MSYETRTKIRLRQHFWAGAFAAQKVGDVRFKFGQGVLAAPDRTCAVGAFERMALEEMPTTDGWTNHKLLIRDVTGYIVDQLLLEIGDKEC